jgi:cell division protein FtsQ
MTVLIAAAAFPQSALFTLEQVDVRGASVLTPGDVVAATGLRFGERLFAVDAGQVTRRLQAHPRIKAASVRVRVPRTVIVTITEREPIIALAAGDHALLVDADLVVVAAVTASRSRLPEVIDRAGGLPPAQPGDPARSMGARAAVAALAQMPAPLRDALARIVVEPGPDLTLITHAGLEIRAGGPAGLSDRLAQVPAVLDALRARQVNVEAIDLRYAGSIVVRPARGGDGR